MPSIESFNKSFAKRGAFLFFVSVCLFFGCILRIAVISSGNEYAVLQKEQTYKRITISRLRGTVFDCNLSPMTNTEKAQYIAVAPTPEGITAVSQILSGSEKEKVLEELKSRNVSVFRSENGINNKNIISSYVYSDNKNETVSHIIGYVGSDGHGVCGIQKAYDDVLYSEKTVDVLYSVSGKGEYLYGENPEFSNDLSVVSNGVVLTIDKKIQNIVLDETKDLQKGAAIVCEAESGKIKAIVSKPSYSLTNLPQMLNDNNSPLLNRAMSSFSVGSVFKPCVAAAAIESGFGGFSYECVGKTHIIDRDFSCHNKEGHGILDLKGALAFSCNTYFYNLGINVGAKSIRKIATSLNFGNKLILGKNIETDKGNLTPISNLQNDAQVANFSIGQGEIIMSPISLLTLYLSIAGDGSYYSPSIVDGIVKDGKIKEYDKGYKTKAMEKATADKLKDALREVVLAGLGNSASTQVCEVAGKTATAQTGRYDETGTEITNSWFCGFFPFNNPKYVVIVMSDGKTDYPVTSIFSKIAERMVLESL